MRSLHRGRSLTVALLSVVVGSGCGKSTPQRIRPGMGGSSGAATVTSANAGWPTGGGTAAGGSSPTAASIAQDVEATLGQLSLDEKLSLLGGTETNFDTAGVQRDDLTVPALRMTDGPVGVRRYDEPPATAFPAAIALAATFSRSLAERYGRALAHEAKWFGRNVLLGPCVNIARVPQGGRNFESYGEDPLLAAAIAADYVRGVQAEGVVATVKHFAANNQETQRDSIDVIVDERTLREIYLPAFESAVTQGGAKAVMCSYNKVNGAWACENRHLLREVLRDDWGFNGLLMSDWGATHSTDVALNAGLDLEMGQAHFLTPERVKVALSDGSVEQAVVDDAVRHQLRAIAEMQPVWAASNDSGSLARPIDIREFARSGIVLLKNDEQRLPLNLRSLGRIAVLGPYADTYVAGGGSSHVPPRSITTPLAGIRALAGTESEVVYAEGGNDAVAAAQSADVALLFLGDANESEWVDRTSLTIADSQVALLRSVLAVNVNTIVVLINGAPLVMRDWLDEVSTLVEAWYGGAEQGSAIADVLFGHVSPAGHLPVTFPKRWEDCPAFGRFPGSNGTVHYDEGLLVGYRYFDTLAIEPEFPFGHGLSYVPFEYSSLEIGPPGADGLTRVSVNVRNAGTMPADEVVQLYVSAVNSAVERPLQTLAAFERVAIAAGETVDVALDVLPRAFSHFDTATNAWVLDRGAFELRVGRSSRDIRLRGTVTIP